MTYILYGLMVAIPYLLIAIGTVAAVLIIKHFHKKADKKDTPGYKLVRNLNAIMATAITFFLCRSVFYIWGHVTHPEVHATYAAPWYTGMMLLGAFTAAVVLICLVIKVIVKHRIKKLEYKFIDWTSV